MYDMRCRVKSNVGQEADLSQQRGMNNELRFLRAANLEE